MIRRLRRQVPDGLQPRVRLLFGAWAVVFSAVNGLSLLLQPTSASARLLGALAIVHFVVSIVLVERRGGRPRAVDLVLDPLAVTAFTLALGDPMQVLGVVYAVLLYRAQFRPTWRIAYLVPAVSAAYLVGVAFAAAPSHPGLHWNDPAVLSMVPGFVVVGVLMRLLGITLGYADRSASRERIVARAGEALLRAGSVEETLDPAVRALESLLGSVGARADVACLVALTDGDLLEVRAAVGGAPHELVGAVLPGSAVHALDSAARVALPDQLAIALGRLVPSAAAWQVVPLEAHGQLHGCLLIRNGARLPRELDTTLVTLATQIALGVAGRRAEAELARRAWNDGLTALPNRGLFTRALEEARQRHAERPERLAVLFIDLDDFKAVNDTLGHEAGDELLVQVSDRLRQALRPQDLAARLGGDEFAVVLDGVLDADEALTIGQRLVEELRRPFHLTADSVRIGASVGIALGSAGLDTTETLRCADVAMYTAKAQGKGRVLVFDQVNGDPDPGLAVASPVLPDGFTVRYRPRVDVTAGVTATSEVSLRWDHPAHGPLLDRQALAQAEAEGHGPAVSAWLLETTCRQAMVWRARYGERAPGVCSPVTAQQLAAADVVQAVTTALTRTGAPPDLLTVQVTADALATPRSRETVARLAALGVHVALELEGAAPQALAAVQAVPVSELLIDMLAVEDVDFARALCVVASRAGVRSVAVHVDDALAVSMAEHLGVTCAQGEAVAPVVSGDDLGRWLLTPAGRAS